MVRRRGRGKTVCARGADQAAVAGRSASPLERMRGIGNSKTQAGDESTPQRRLRLTPTLVRALAPQGPPLSAGARAATAAMNAEESGGFVQRQAARLNRLGRGGFA